jgi:hypothetical protein
LRLDDEGCDLTGNPLHTAIRRLLRRVATPAGADISDAELLERFVQQRDQAAIETRRSLPPQHGSSNDGWPTSLAAGQTWKSN